MFDMYLELFISHLENKNRSLKTMSDYQKLLMHFFEFLISKKVEEVNKIKTLHIDLYLNELIKNKNVSSSRKKKVSIIKSFFKFLQSREYIDKNPTEVVEQIKVKDVDKKTKYVLSEKESEKLLKAVTKYSRNKEKSRFLILIMLKCALRVDEVCHLKITDINMKNKTIKIDGKGGKRRHVPLFEEMIPDLKAYLKNRKDKSEFLFTSKNSEKPLKTRAVHSFVKEYVEKAKINKVIGCHALRRTAATRLLQAGTKITTIQKFLGHANISTTQMYLLEDEDEIQEEIRSKTKNILTSRV